MVFLHTERNFQGEIFNREGGLTEFPGENLLRRWVFSRENFLRWEFPVGDFPIEDFSAWGAFWGRI